MWTMSEQGQWKINKGKLLVAAPPEMWGELSRGLGKGYSEIELYPVERSAITNFPKTVNTLAEKLDPAKDYLLVIAGSRRAAGNVIDSFMPRGIPTGIVFANKPGDLSHWLYSLDKPVPGREKRMAVLSMWKDFYLKWADLYSSALQKGYSGNGISVEKWYADEISKTEVGNLLSKGPSLAIYVGHGRSRGWTGYRGLRWHDIEKHRNFNPIGTLMSVTCKNLLVENNKVPFGVKWVMTGRARTFMGAVHDVKINPLKKISNRFIKVFESGEYSDFSSILRIIDTEIKSSDDKEVLKCWNKFRLIGDPSGFF